MKVLNFNISVSAGMVRLISLVTAMLSLIVMMGWIVHDQSLVRLLPVYAPMQFNTALCFFLSSIAMLALDARPNWVAPIASAATLIFVLLTLSEYLLDIDYGIDMLFITPFMKAGIYHANRMAPATAITFICDTAVILFCSLTRRWHERKLFTIALLGSLIAAQGAVTLLGYLCGVNFTPDWDIFTAMTANSAANFILLGIAIVAYSWKKSESLPLWLPVPVGIGLIIASIAMAQGVRSYEEAKMEDTLQLEAQSVAHDAEIYLSGLYNALDRIGGRWSAAGGTPRALWENDVGAYLNDYPTIVGISWINAKSEIQWVMPLTATNSKVIGFNLSREPRRAAAIEKAFTTHQSQTTRQVTLLNAGGRGFLYVCPLYIGSRFDGLIAAVMRMDNLFSKLISDAKQSSFYFSIRDRDELLWSTLPANQPVPRMQKDAAFRNKSNDWTIEVSPKPDNPTFQSTPFAYTVLAIGLLATLLITWSLSSTLKGHYTMQVLREREELLKQALSKLYNSERIKQAIFDSSQYFIISSDTTGIITTFNKYASDMLGYSREEIIGRMTPEPFHDKNEVIRRASDLSIELGEIVEPGYATFVTKAARGFPDENEWTYIRKDGSRFAVQLSVTTLRDENNQINGYLGIAKDITKAKEAEETLRKSEENFRSSFENAMIGMALVSPEGRWLKVNKALCAIVGYSSEELLATDFQTITYKEDLNADIYYVQQMLRKEISTYQMEKRYIHKEGHLVWIMLSVSLVWNHEGKPLYFISQIQDITQRKSMERMKNEFVSTVSHELRTPLTSIRGSLGLMRAGVVGEMPPKAKEMTDIAYNNAERLILLINDILDIDKIESGQMRFDMKEHEVNELLQQAVKDNHAYGDKFDVTFIYEPLEEPACILVDSNRLIQVLSNLLSNAAKFSPTGEKVRILCTHKNRKIRISVIDKGPGIPEEFRSRIFSKFAQADSSSSRQKSGTGLGLNISKQIIEHMHGAIGFSSQAGQGTTFWIELPEFSRQTSQELHDAIEYLDADDRNFLPYILHAEDDYGMCRIIAQALQGKAIVHAAPTVTDASRLLKLYSYDLLILDLSLPDGTGLKLIDQIEDEKLPTQIVILSASEIDEDMQNRVAMALVKSKVPEEKAVEHILSLLPKHSS